MYTPQNHYWIRADGTLYSSATMEYVQADDSKYLAWRAQGGIATKYPLDMMGTESQTELAAILAPYGLYISAADSARAKRDAAIEACEWLTIRHRDQTDAGTATTLTAAQYKELLTYRQALRDWPTTTGWPDVDMPAAPSWM